METNDLTRTRAASPLDRFRFPPAAARTAPCAPAAATASGTG